MVIGLFFVIVAPEIFATAREETQGYSFGVDWWSLGVCIYEILRAKVSRWSLFSCNMSSMRCSVSSSDETPRRESKIQHTQLSIFNELWGVSSGDETLCRMLDIISQTKMILEREIKDAKMSSFSSDFQTLLKH